MPLDPNHVDLLLQYVLLVAGEEDKHIDRELGPIHLIKYVYLADLAYARSNAGKTFTGIDWQFQSFGPWSQAVHERIEPALLAINSDKKTVPSNHEDKDDGIRWSLRDERLLQEREWKLPTDITMHLKRYVHRFGKDTPSLLDHVYSTKPMLSAAPNEHLDFSLAVEAASSAESEPRPLRRDNLSEKKKKKLNERMRALTEQHKTRKPKELRLVHPVQHPRYDEIYQAGIAWLDDLAGQPLTPGKKAAEFSDEVWKSATRKGGDVS
ncbi:MAG: hypothetical protein WD823_02985 [Sulfuricaulis sp.]|uniref:hypothetical protein n=1 Tax=Sulfuricaulis sp. TaxID=2003553 RepID=UPI0034A1D27C